MYGVGVNAKKGGLVEKVLACISSKTPFLFCCELQLQQWSVTDTLGVVVGKGYCRETICYSMVYGSVVYLIFSMVSCVSSVQTKNFNCVTPRYRPIVLALPSSTYIASKPRCTHSGALL